MYPLWVRKKSFSNSPKMNPSLKGENLWLPGRKTEGGSVRDAAETLTFVSLIPFPFWPQPRRALWEIEEGGVLALIKFEFPALGREAAGLLSHHLETLPSRCGSLASLNQPHCHMNNHTAVAGICWMGMRECVCVKKMEGGGRRSSNANRGLLIGEWGSSWLGKQVEWE